MKRTLLLSFALISALLILYSSCQKSPYTGFKETSSGMYYKFHYRSGDTNKPQLNELMTLDLQYGTEDSTLFDSKLTGRPMIIPLAESQYEGDIYEALAMMAVGDSATFILAADSFYLVTARAPMVPDFIDSNGVIFFDVKLIASQTQEEFQAERQRQNQERAQEELANLEKYLEENHIEVEPTGSGLYFIETEIGSGRKPKEGEWIKVHFSLSLLDNQPIYTTFDTEPRMAEYGKTFENQGFTEALSMMSKGSRAQLIIPSNIAFGEKGRGDIVPPYSTLLYDVQLVDILTADQYKAEQERIKQERKLKDERNKIESQRFLQENSKKEGVVTLPSGLQYKVNTMGTGPKPGPEDVVTVHYRGTLINGTVFDSSYDRGQPAQFRVNGVIQGWTEALQLMPVGSNWTLYVPSELAYKDMQRGQFIEPNMALIFDVELIDIENEQ